MLRRGDDVLRLQGSNHMPPELAREIWIFAVGFLRPSPSRIARQVQYRRVHVRVAERTSLTAGDASDLIHQRAIPCAGDGELRRETRRARVGESADAFVGKVDRNSQPGLFDKKSLNRVDRFGVPRERVGQL